MESELITEWKWDKQKLNQLYFLSQFADIVVDGDRKTIRVLRKSE